MILEAKKLNDQALSLKNEERCLLRRIKEIQEDPASNSFDEFELNRLEENADRSRQEYDETYSHLKPLLDEIRGFVKLLMDEKRERR